MTRTTAVIAAVGLALAACKGGGTKGGAKPAGSAGTATAAGASGDWLGVLPTVAAGRPTLAPTGDPPRVVVLADDHGALYLAAVTSWADLARDPRPGAKRVDADLAYKAIAEGAALRLDGKHVVEQLGTPGDLAALEPDDPPPAGLDDPPPPEEEDEEESGGTGTAMALDEGKMGKKDSDRAEGQYRMQRAGTEDSAAAIAAAERAHKAGPLGSRAFASLGRGFDDPIGDADRLPVRQAAIVGTVQDQLPTEERDRYAVMMASAKAPVKALLPVIEAAPVIAVVSDGAVRLLRLQFRRVRDQAIDATEPKWIEVRIWPIGLDVEAVPEKAVSVPWTGGALDPAAVAAAYDGAMKSRGLDKDYPVDVLVSPDTDVQHLVDVVVALDAAGAHVIGLGEVPRPGDVEALKRGHRIPIAHMGPVEAIGDLDRKQIGGGLRAQLGAIEECYTTALAATPDATGVVTVAFLIDKKGSPRKVKATGLTPEVAACVAAQVGKATFQAPASGTVQVSVAFTMTN